MIKKYSILTFTIPYILFAGFSERGEVIYIPPLTKEVIQKESMPQDYPVLKISAKSIPTTQIDKLIPTTSTKIIHKKKKRKKDYSLGNIPFISDLSSGIKKASLLDIPIVNKVIPKPSKVAKTRIKKRLPKIATQHINTATSKPTPHILNNINEEKVISFSGGTSINGLDIGRIRIKTDTYQTNLILDSYIWAGYNKTPTKPSAESGIYFFKYEPKFNRIIGQIKGYNSFSALKTKQSELLKNNNIISGIYIDSYIGNDGIKFIIELKKKVTVDIVSTENPASIIIVLDIDKE